MGSPSTTRMDPENKYLSHSFVESPEMLNVYSGTVTTGEGRDGARSRCRRISRRSTGISATSSPTIGEFARAVVSEEIDEQPIHNSDRRPSG